jgi:alpha-tubulin suppressor-like RCC1 family protein
MENEEKLKESNSIYSWGFAKYGQIGSLEYQYVAEPIEVCQNQDQEFQNKKIKMISYGEFHSSFITHDNKIYLYGKNTFGQLGLGHNDISCSPIFPEIFHKIQIEKVACGGEHTIAIGVNNDLYSWGLNVFGQLGLSHLENKNMPTRVEKIRYISKNEEGRIILKEYSRKIESDRIIEIAAGAQHSMFLTLANQIYSCGFAKNCSLGYFTSEDDPMESSAFTRIPTKSTTKKYSKISCGINHSGCVVGTNEILIWGKGDNMSFDQQTKIIVNPGSQTNQSKPLAIVDFQIGENFFIIQTDSGDLHSFGSNEYGQLGIGSQNNKKSLEKVLINEKIKSFSAGYSFVYALSEKGNLYGWGSNKYGQLLELSTERITTPKLINNFINNKISITQIKCGAYHVGIIANSTNKKLLTESIQTNPLLNYKLFPINKSFDPMAYQNDIRKLTEIETLYKYLNEQIIQKEELITKLGKSIEEKKVVEKKKLNRHSRKSEKDVRSGLIDPVQLFDEEIKFSELVFLSNADCGVGTFGEVKRGYWRKTLVAIKFLKKSIDNEEEAVKSFIEELNLLKKLRHPNILLYVGACTTGPNYFLVTEYCEQGNLFDFLHTGRRVALQSKDRLRIALEIAKGVNYLHSFKPPILHRDLKSLNILLDKNLTVKIADFGWARLRDIHMTKQRGTFQWMAPEVIRKNSYSEKADVFSFGIILWELWVQEPPYKNIDRIIVAKKVATDRNYRPRLDSNTIPDEMKQLMVACWDYDPDQRPTFEEIIDYLEKERENLI